MRLLHRGTQIESRLAEAWRSQGCYRNARSLLAAAVVEDQFNATTRPHRGVTVMTIHKASVVKRCQNVSTMGRFTRNFQLARVQLSSTASTRQPRFFHAAGV